jgi:hypothetical protein
VLELQFDFLFQSYRFSNEEMRVLRQCNRDSFYQRCLPLATILGVGTYYGVQSGGFIQMLFNILISLLNKVVKIQGKVH